MAATIKVKDFLTEEQIVSLFDYFDTDNTGFITRDNLKEAFLKAGKQLSDKEIDKIMESHDIAQNGILDFEEFKQMMTENVDFTFEQD